MKKIITSLFIIVFSCGQLPAQTQIVAVFNATPSVNLPYGTNIGHSQGPQHYYHFPFMLWGNSLNINLWNDLGLTVSIVNNSNDPYIDCTIYSRFTSSNGNYYLGLIGIGAGDDWKGILITATTTGAYIDALEVSVSGGYWVDGLQSIDLYPKQWKIDTNMQVTVYRLKPTSSIMFGANSTVLSTIHAQRIDEIYQINSLGQFIKTDEILYQSKNYPLSTFSDEAVNIWDGGEVPL